MAEELPDGTRQGYFTRCERCGTTVETNIQGNNIDDHNCKIDEKRLLEIIKHKSSPITIEWNNSRGGKSVAEYHFTFIDKNPKLYTYEIENILGRLNSPYCKGVIL